MTITVRAGRALLVAAALAVSVVVPLTVTADSQVVFLYLTPLKGG